MIPTKFPCKMRSIITGSEVVITSITPENIWGPNVGTGSYVSIDSRILAVLMQLPSYQGNGVFNDFGLDNFEEIKEN